MSYSAAMADTPCKEPGRLVPVIDRNRCEGKAECVKLCPYGVFEMGSLDTEARGALSGRGRIRAFFHGYKQAMIVQPDQCHACGLCVSACPEHAIKLRAVDSPAEPAR